MKILVVDDDGVTRKLLGLYLKGTGYEVEFAENGLDALEKLGIEDINIVLTDLNMPYMDGIEFTRNMKIEPLYKSIPVLMVTTESDDEEKQRAFEAGADGYLVKPVTAETINATIRELLKRIFSHGGEINV
ncbi:chemotaxis protein CheY [bacterium BMS3Bbin06]|nr:chemotaxis protein CheY [bacterium BMS3Bbin06]HDH00560.1 response regulator [Nitrospirota bacterium]HDO35338.1 response regulator [Nitrospirota bacterium]